MNESKIQPSKLHKEVSRTFDGDALSRGKWVIIEAGHTYIEICKMPFLRWGEEVADVGKYILGFGLLAILVLLVEWHATGTFM